MSTRTSAFLNNRHVVVYMWVYSSVHAVTVHAVVRKTLLLKIF